MFNFIKFAKYPYWHYFEAPEEIFKGWRNFIKFFAYFFSIRLLILTLFSPWKRDITLRERGFDIKKWLRAFVLNAVTRFFGAIARLTVIASGLVFETVVLFIGLFFIIFWYLFPVVIFASFVYALAVMSESAVLAVGIIIGDIILIFFALRAFVNNEKENAVLKLILTPKSWDDFDKESLKFFAERTGANPAKDFKDAIFNAKIKEGDVLRVMNWYKRREMKKIRKKKFWSYDNLLSLGSIGKDWHYGYTPYLDMFSADITKEITRHGMGCELIGKDKDIDSIETVLSRSNENNILIIGAPGVGVGTLIKGLARRIWRGESRAVLNSKRVLDFDPNLLSAGAKNYEEILSRIMRSLSEAAYAGNIILVINGIHNFVKTRKQKGDIDLSYVLIEYLPMKNIRFIATTTKQGFHKELESRVDFIKYFEELEVKEPAKEDVMAILEDALPKLENRHKIKATYQALRDIYEKTSRYILNVPQPEKSVDVLEEVFSKTLASGSKFIRENHVDDVISRMVKMPVGELTKEEKEKLLNLEDTLHKRIVNQNTAIRMISEAMRRARTDVSRIKKPIGTFIFLGPTGVGKTETAKALASAYFNDEKRMIRFDMSEYQEVKSIERLIGSNDGSVEGRLVKAVEDDPFSLILFDEIEKAHPDVINLFLQLLDEGRLTSGTGKIMSYVNTIIIATSNAGSEIIRKKTEQGIDVSAVKKELMDYLFKNRIFRPEFINRFDGVVVFSPLSRENTERIAELMLANFKTRLKKQDIDFVITDEIVKRVSDLGYNPSFGARPMQRIIQDKIESLIAKKILEGKIKRGSEVIINPQELD